MRTHNICFRGEIRKISILLDCRKASNLDLCDFFQRKYGFTVYINRLLGRGFTW